MGHPFFYASSQSIDRLKCLLTIIDVLHFNTEMFFQKDDNLNGIERVETQTFNEEASLETMSLSFTYTSVLAVPRPIAKYFDIKPKNRSNIKSPLCKIAAEILGK